MKKNRYLPFGYHIQNGVLCIHEAEVAVVRQVFEDYQAGMSYRRIAESLTAQGISYIENRTDWNKHMVKRMLENSRYCGRDDFPPIIPVDTFGTVTALIGQKIQGEPLSEELDSIRSKAICRVCGAKYKRDGRSKNYEAWCCSAEGRITPKRITDQALLENVTAILNTIIREPNLLEFSSAASGIPMVPSLHMVYASFTVILNAGIRACSSLPKWVQRSLTLTIPSSVQPRSSNLAMVSMRLEKVELMVNSFTPSLLQSARMVSISSSQMTSAKFGSSFPASLL